MKFRKVQIKDKRRPIIILAAAVLIAYLFCLPRDLFKGTSYSTVIEDRNGELMGARIASDGQWRFPPSDEVPDKFKAAIIEFEDRWFLFHPGVNPVSIVRAAFGNIKAGHVTSGGSTLTMQVIRLSRGKERTLWQKIIEAVLATRLELRHSKKKILAIYASHAPFGGNVVLPVPGGPYRRMWSGLKPPHGAITDALHKSYPGQRQPLWPCCRTHRPESIQGKTGKSFSRKGTVCSPPFTNAGNWILRSSSWHWMSLSLWSL